MVVNVAVVAAAVVVIIIATSVVVVVVVATAVIVDVVRWVCGVVPIEAALTVTVMMGVGLVAVASVGVVVLISAAVIAAIAAAVTSIIDIAASQTVSVVGVFVAIVAVVAAHTVLAVRVVLVVSAVHNGVRFAAASFLMAVVFVAMCGQASHTASGRHVLHSQRHGGLVSAVVIVIGCYWRTWRRRTWSSTVVVYGTEDVVDVARFGKLVGEMSRSSWWPGGFISRVT